MTRTLIALAALAAATISVTPAVAAETDDIFAAFKQVCGDTRADYAASVAAAAHNGWHSAEVTASAMNGVTVSEHSGQAKTVGGVPLMLSATQGAAAKDPTIHVTTCTVQAGKGDFAALKAAAQGWLGFAPASTTDTSATFRFTEENGHLRAAEQAEFNTAAAGTGMQLLTIKRDGAAGVLDYVKIKK